jgi:hypothetical protein
MFIESVERINAKARIESFQSAVESLMLNRFGTLDKELAAIIPSLIELPPTEFTFPHIKMSRFEKYKFSQKSI